MSLLVFSSFYVSFCSCLIQSCSLFASTQSCLVSCPPSVSSLPVSSSLVFLYLLLSSSPLLLSCLKTVLVSSILVLSLLFQSHLLFSSLFVSSSLVVFCLFSVSCCPLIYLPVSSPLIFHFLSLLLFSSYSLLVLSRLVSCLNSSHRLVFLLASSWSFIFLSPLFLSCLFSSFSSSLISSHYLLSFVSSRVVLLSFCLFKSSLIASHALLVVCPVSSHLNFSHFLGSSSCLLLALLFSSCRFSTSLQSHFLSFASLCSFSSCPYCLISVPLILSSSLNFST